MATDVSAFVTALQGERASVQAELNAIDLMDEETMFAQAEQALLAARQTHKAAADRWGLVQDKLSRRVTLDAQIAMLGIG